MIKFDNARIIGYLSAVFLFFVVFVVSIAIYIQDFSEKEEVLQTRIENLEQELYEVKMQKGILESDLNMINANREAQVIIESQKEKENED